MYTCLPDNAPATNVTLHVLTGKWKIYFHPVIFYAHQNGGKNNNSMKKEIFEAYNISATLQSTVLRQYVQFKWIELCNFSHRRLLNTGKRLFQTIFDFKSCYREFTIKFTILHLWK